MMYCFCCETSYWVVTIEGQALMLTKQIVCLNTTYLLLQDTLKFKLSIVLVTLNLRIINHFVQTQLCFQSSGRGIAFTKAYHIIYVYHHSKCTSFFSSSSLTKKFVEGCFLCGKKRAKTLHIAHSKIMYTP